MPINVVKVRGAESVRVARSQGNEPGVRVRVRVDKAALTLTPDCLLQFDPVMGFQKNFFGEVFGNITAY